MLYYISFAEIIIIIFAGKTASTEAGGIKDDRERPPLRKFLLEGDFFVGAALAGTLTKLALRFADAVASEAKGQIKANRFIGEAMLVLASVLHLGQSGLPSKAITNDDADRIALCLKVNI